MEALNIASIALLAAIAAAGILLKRYTKHRLRDMDGCGDVCKNNDANHIKL